VIIAGLRKGEEGITAKPFGLMQCQKIDDSIGHKAGEYMKSLRAWHSKELADALIAAIAHAKLRASDFKSNVSRLKQRSIDFRIKIVYSQTAGIHPGAPTIPVMIEEARPIYALYCIRGSLKSYNQMYP